MNIPTGYRVRGQKTLALFSFVWRKRDCSLTTEYSFAKYFLFVIVMSISVRSSTPRPADKQIAMKGGERAYTDSKYRVALGFAITHKEHNGTPVQSQSEREKNVAGNEGGSVRTTVGVELPWRQFAADRLATSHSISGCRGQIEMLLSYQPNERRS